jgi:hypothetical protein
MVYSKTPIEIILTGNPRTNPDLADMVKILYTFFYGVAQFREIDMTV